jgi:hypothetical protein
MANTPTITFGQLATTLRTLGYAPDGARSGPGYVVYAHHGPGRIITLPAATDREAVPSMYLNAIRGNLRLSLPDEVSHFDRLLDDLAAPHPAGVG